jgi:hypothetical protein
MSDETVEIPAALQERLVAEVKEAYKETEKESRRSLEITTSFYDKLSALDAGSIAVAVSIGIALIAKSERPTLLANAGWLAGITVSLWFSLVCAVAHNFVVVRIAKRESAYHEVEFVRTILRQSMAMVNAAFPTQDQRFDQLLTKVQETPILEQQHIVKRIQFLHRCAPPLAYISIASFLAAYTIVVARVVRLWWIIW